MNQRHYIESLAKKFSVLNFRTFKTPMEQNLRLDRGEDNVTNSNFRSLIGALLYISMNTRPDILFSINYVSRFQNCCTDNHYKHALRVLKYVYHTRYLSLNYSKRNSHIIAYSDAD